jgi:hypothetical protein
MNSSITDVPESSEVSNSINSADAEQVSKSVDTSDIVCPLVVVVSNGSEISNVTKSPQASKSI